MRLRELYDQAVNSEYDCLYSYPANNNQLVPWTESFQSARRYKGMLDVETPNYHSRSAAGEVIISPMWKSSFETVSVPADIQYRLTQSGYSLAHMRYYNTWVQFEWSQNVLCDDLPDSDSIFDQSADDRNEAIAKAWANVDESEIQLLASLGELPETMRWIASIYRRSLTVIRLFNRKRSVLQAIYFAAKTMSKRKNASLLAELWLEYRYAFRPLVFEMQQAVSALHKNVKKNSRNTGRGFKFMNDVSSRQYVQAEDMGRAHLTFTETTRTSTQLRAGVLYRIEDDLSSVLAIWGIDQPLETAWELLPFSFIVDWFFNIGDVISGWTDNTGLTPLGSWIVENVQRTVTAQAVSVDHENPPSGFIARGVSLNTNGTFTGLSQYSRRICNPSLSLIPSIKLNLDLAKCLDLATIARGLFLSGGRVKIGGSNVR